MIRNVVRVGVGTGILLMAALTGQACDDGGIDLPTEAADTARIEATVTADGSGRGGVTVRLFTSGSETVLSSKVTASSGLAAFVGLEAGTYDAGVEVPSDLVLDEGETARKSVTVAEGDTGAVSFALVTKGDTGGDVVEIRLTSGNRFNPSSVTISPGTTVRWVNDIDRFHTITPRSHSEWVREEISAANATFVHTFETAGTFEYFCEPHESEGMTGVITVQ